MKMNKGNIICLIGLCLFIFGCVKTAEPYKAFMERERVCPENYVKAKIGENRCYHCYGTGSVYYLVGGVQKRSECLHCKGKGVRYKYMCEESGKKNLKKEKYTSEDAF